MSYFLATPDKYLMDEYSMVKSLVMVSTVAASLIGGAGGTAYCKSVNFTARVSLDDLSVQLSE